MTEKRSIFRVLITSLLIALIALPNTLYAQGFEFGEDEAAEEEGGEGMEFGEEGADKGSEEGMSFDSNDLSKEDKVVDEDAPSVAIIALPGANMDPERQRAVQGAMSTFAQSVPGIQPTGPETALPSLIERDPDRCATEPICLGAVGDQAAVDRMILARVIDDNGTLKIVMDYFDVQDRLFIRSSTQEVSSTGDMVDAVEPGMKDVLAIRDKNGKKDFTGNEDTGIVQDVIAWGAAGLAVGALVGGIVFGLAASSKEEEVAAAKNADGKTYSITQKEAEAIFSEASDTATTANIFYGLAGALAVTSAVFFIIRGGSDVSTDQDRVDLIQDFQIAPVVTEAGAGIGAAFRF